MRNSNIVTAASQQRSIENAGRSKDPFASMPDVFNYKSAGEDGRQFTLYSKQKNDMDSKVLKWAFKLAERNVSQFYKELSIGWQPKVKQNDLNKAWARYLVALDSNKVPVAYAMFRFDMDYGSAVLYCYEMHVEPAVQRQGLGRHMMLALERCAKHWKMQKIVLTVLKNNHAMTFFKSIGFTVDESSPDASQRADYEILSKML